MARNFFFGQEFCFLARSFIFFAKFGQFFNSDPFLVRILPRSLLLGSADPKYNLFGRRQNTTFSTKAVPKDMPFQKMSFWPAPLPAQKKIVEMILFLPRADQK